MNVRAKILNWRGLALMCCLMFAVEAAWLPLKAELAQVLIKRSWSNLQQTGQATPPWPWADTQALAELSFLRLKRTVIVLNGADPTSLAFSVGALAPFNQAFLSQPFIVAGHNDSHFNFLAEVNMKDIISLADASGRTQLYQVEAIDIIDVQEQNLSIEDEQQGLILVTCYPFNAATSGGSERYIIKAKPLNVSD